ncbi:hypothetical protein QYM36_006143 [Artemia franciscana]|uniref:Caspase family p20 domain-containing protein n=2 Tax=Artemia franciscana TaxID=6661 RepID=A0AA88HVV1_ARTSF|nr:hypothetical protein QYM36_006143 [Artemia franciscana]
MNNRERGRAIIFNNRVFSSALDLPIRHGTDNDRDTLVTQLSKLGFSVSSYNDPTLKKIKTELKKVSEEDHSNRDTLMIVVLSHGGPETLCAQDMTYSPELLWSNFYDHNCPTLAKKPRLFFIQACQGKKSTWELL